MKLGIHKIKVCADVDHEVREANEHNNCKPVKTPDGFFFVNQREWSGTLSGSGCSPGGLTETWESKDARYVFNNYLVPGVFVYAFNGTVTWRISGEEPRGVHLERHRDRDRVEQPLPIGLVLDL